MTHSLTQQRVLRAGDYSLPDNVAAATKAIFGMHGLPLARRTADARRVGQPGGTPPPVTPDVINAKYVERPPKHTRTHARTLSQTHTHTRIPMTFYNVLVGVLGTRSPVAQHPLESGSLCYFYCLFYCTLLSFLFRALHLTPYQGTRSLASRRPNRLQRCVLLR